MTSRYGGLSLLLLSVLLASVDSLRSAFGISILKHEARRRLVNSDREDFSAEDKQVWRLSKDRLHALFFFNGPSVLPLSVTVFYFGVSSMVAKIIVKP